jgi:hypothetical protein
MDCLMEMGLALSKPPSSLTARNSVTYRLQGQTGIAGVDSMVLKTRLGQSPGLNKHAQCVKSAGVMKQGACPTVPAVTNSAITLW